MSEHVAGGETQSGGSGSPLPRFGDDAQDLPDGVDNLGETVGAADRDADAVRSGADLDTADAENWDTDGVPVGPADADADARRAGADPSGT